MTMTKKPLEVSTPSDLEVAVARSFDAPRAKVFAAFTQPALVRRWLLGPPGWGMPVCEIDLRVGGAYRYQWSHPEQGSFGMSGTFREVDAPKRIVHSERYEQGGPDAEAIVTTLFEEHDGITTVTMTMRFATKAARDAALASGMTDGMAVSYDRLEDVLRAAG